MHGLARQVYPGIQPAVRLTFTNLAAGASASGFGYLQNAESGARLDHNRQMYSIWRAGRARGRSCR